MKVLKEENIKTLLKSESQIHFEEILNYICPSEVFPLNEYFHSIYFNTVKFTRDTIWQLTLRSLVN